MRNFIYGDAQLLASIREMDMHYIVRPHRAIRKMLCKAYLFETFLCAMLSVGILWVPMIPVWCYCFFRMYIRIQYLKKFNVSSVRMVIMTIMVVAAEIVISIYLRSIIWESVAFI